MQLLHSYVPVALEESTSWSVNKWDAAEWSEPPLQLFRSDAKIAQDKSGSSHVFQFSLEAVACCEWIDSLNNN